MQNYREEAEGLDPSHLAEEVLEKLRKDNDDV